MTNWPGTARKLLVGFGALVVVFGAASWATLAGHRQIHAAIERTKEEEEGVRLALELASAVRDQYAHQAHTIIIGNESHLGFYSQAEQHVLELIRALRARTRYPDERVWMDDIERATAELDRVFRRQIVPAVVKGDRRYVQEEHGRAQLLVTEIQDRVEQLVNRREARIAAARAEVAAVEHHTLDWIIGLMIGTPLLAAAVTLYVGRSIGRPLAVLRGGAQRIAAGDLDTRIEIASDDEFGALAEQFNTMTSALKEHQAQLVQSEKLAGVGRLAAGVAHELNNPLAVILGYVRLLRKRASGDLDDDLAVVEQETLRCKDIVRDLLDLSRPLQAGQEPLDLRSTSDDVVATLRGAHTLDGVEVEVDGHATAQGNPSKIRQVVANLVRNAAEAAGRGGRVQVKVGSVESQASVEVHDSGPGLDGRVADRLFEPFFTTKERGTGLGLAISRAIARAHGGDVDARNAPGGGATFTLTLPRRGDAAPDRAGAGGAGGGRA